MLLLSLFSGRACCLQYGRVDSAAVAFEEAVFLRLLLGVQQLKPIGSTVNLLFIAVLQFALRTSKTFHFVSIRREYSTWV